MKLPCATKISRSTFNKYCSSYSTICCITKCTCTCNSYMYMYSVHVHVYASDTEATYSVHVHVHVHVIRYKSRGVQSLGRLIHSV